MSIYYEPHIAYNKRVYNIVLVHRVIIHEIVIYEFSQVKFNFNPFILCRVEFKLCDHRLKNYYPRWM